MRRHAEPVEELLDVAELTTQVRSYAALDDDEVGALLEDVRTSEAVSARRRLVEHHLGIALDEARLRGDRGVELGDLFQEGTLAVIAAVEEYALRGAAPAGLAEFTREVVAAHLDATVEAAALEQRSDEAFVRDAQLFETAEVSLRRRLGRSATPTELASLLEWPAERVQLMADMLAAARSLYDSDIAQYLDDE